VIEIPLVLMAGLLGSSHCVGMCGGFVLSLGASASSWRQNLVRQLLYTLGRMFTYAALGAAAGFVGLRLTGRLPGLVNVPAALAILAGLLLVGQGLWSAGVFRRRAVTRTGPCLTGSLFRHFTQGAGRGGAFLAGVLTGFLPCGLLYGMLALAGSSRSMPLGAAIMAVFALGTAPAMILTGTGGSLLSLSARRHMLHVAAWCVVLTGLMSLWRGIGFLEIPGLVEATGCPNCTP